MNRLIYFSTARPLFDEKSLINLLAVARRNNEKHGITGILLYAKGNFMQVLEGSADNVAHIFAAIQSDERHYDVRVIFNNEVKQRLFPEWTMGFKAFDPDVLSELVGYTSLNSQQEVDETFSQEDFFISMVKSFYKSNQGMSL